MCEYSWPPTDARAIILDVHKRRYVVPGYDNALVYDGTRDWLHTIPLDMVQAVARALAAPQTGGDTLTERLREAAMAADYEDAVLMREAADALEHQPYCVICGRTLAGAPEQ